MGNKNGSVAGGEDASAGSVCGDAALGLGPELLASLQTLGLDGDDTLLPHSLHQIAEACSLKEDYQWALDFLQLEKLYHERLLSNLAALQENWEGQWREKESRDDASACQSSDVISQTHMETLRHICRTHLRPSASVEEQKMTLRGIQSTEEKLQTCRDRVSKPDSTHQIDEEEEDGGERAVRSSTSDLPPEAPRVEAGRDESKEAGEEEAYEEGREVDEEEPFEEEEEVEERVEEVEGDEDEDEDEGKLEWPAGVAQASDRDLAKLSHKEGSSGPDGLVSILKRRRASLDGLPPPSCSSSGSGGRGGSGGGGGSGSGSGSAKESSRRKVRFTEPEDGGEQDVVCRDSCLILLLMCLVTVVISVGGTALYCTLVDNDFAQQLDYCMTNVWEFLGGLGHLLPFRT